MKDMTFDVYKIRNYIGVGLISVLIDFGGSYILNRIFNLELSLETSISHLISFIVANIFGYYANMFWVFKSLTTEKKHITAIKYTFITTINTLWSTYLIGVIATYLFNNYAQLSIITIENTSKILVGLPLGVLGYFLLDYFVFETKDTLSLTNDKPKFE